MKQENSFDISNKSGKAVIRIIGEINFWKNSSQKFTQAIDSIINSGVQDLEMYINSPGGSMFEANEIANQISRFDGKKEAKLGAIAASAASYLMTHFDKVTAASNTQIMMHDPIQILRVQHLEDFDSNRKLYENLRNVAIDRYALKMGIDKEAVSNLMKATTWFSSKEAKEKGLVTDIIDSEEKLPKNTAEVLTQMKIDSIPESITNQFESNKSKIKIENKMKEVLKLLGLPENATEEQAVNAINSIKDSAISAVSELAKSKGLKEDSIKKLANSDLANTLEMVVGSEEKKEEPKETPQANDIVKTIENALKPKETEKEKSFEDYTPAELENMAEKEPEKYEDLINKHFNA